MDHTQLDHVLIRDATEDDTAGIAGLFQAVYGHGYGYADVYDEREVKRVIFDENTLVLVAEDSGSGHIVGSAGVMFVRTFGEV